MGSVLVGLMSSIRKFAAQEGTGNRQDNEKERVPCRPRVSHRNRPCSTDSHSDAPEDQGMEYRTSWSKFCRHVSARDTENYAIGRGKEEQASAHYFPGRWIHMRDMEYPIDRNRRNYICQQSREYGQEATWNASTRWT